MGAAQQRKRAFLAQYRLCYFCNANASTTVDHVPSRECFDDRLAPEDFEFPACKNCNSLHSGIEQVVALYTHMFDLGGKRRPGKQFAKLIRGVANNNPECLPTTLTANEKRRGIKNGHLHPMSYSQLADLPMVGMPAESHVCLELFARKLACALYFKHCGKPVPREYYIMTMSLFASEKRTNDAVKAFVEMLPDYFLGRRINTNIGDQFHYKYGVKYEGELFGFVAQMSGSMYFLGGVSRGFGDMLDHWRLHSSDLMT